MTGRAWQFSAGGVEGLCLEVHDLAISKYVAGREKDREFTELARHPLTDRATLARLAAFHLSHALRKLVAGGIARDFAAPRASQDAQASQLGASAVGHLDGRRRSTPHPRALLTLAKAGGPPALPGWQ
jgi:hypothetical protein